MNNTCPVCNALYNVTSSDVGRRLKCKKCGTALRVAEEGLVQDADEQPGDEALPEAEPERDDRDRDRDRNDRDDRESSKKKKKRRDDADAGPGFSPSINIQTILQWIPTILFAAGVFFVIVFTAFPIIGRAGSDRADAYKQRLETDMAREQFQLQPNKPKNEWLESEKKRIEEETPKIQARYERDIRRAELDARSTRISNIRDVWLEQYGLMFGFVLVAFGCIGFLRVNMQTDYALVIKIVAGTILVLMMLAMFLRFTGCGEPSSPPAKQLPG